MSEMSPYVGNRSGVVELDVEAVKGVFGPTGLFASRLPGYEHRPQQAQMVETVCQALVGKKFAIIEAGTGTGKSLAYLVPSILWAVASGEKVVISTNTINLQEQIIRKDIPFLAHHLDVEFRAVLVKGRSNYVCLLRLQAWAHLVDAAQPAGAEVGAASGSAWLARRLREWAQSAEEGSRSELPPGIPQHVWREICSEGDSCLRSQCPQFGGCFFMKARKAMEDAHLLVVNHHLLFSDIAVRRDSAESHTEAAILPSYKHVILDEAHNVEDVATEHLGYQVKLADIVFLLSSIYRRRSEREVTGLVQGMLKAVGFMGLAAGALDLARVASRVENRLVPLVGSTWEAADALFRILFEVGEALGRVDHGVGRVRMTASVLASDVWRAGVRASWGQLCARLGELAALMGELSADMKQVHDEYGTFDEAFLAEMGAARLRAESMCRSLEFIGRADDEGFVYWADVEGGAKPTDGTVRAAPLDVGPYIRSQLCDKVDSIVLTSATLSVNKSFEFLKNSLGLGVVSKDKLIEVCIGSPFDYKRQTLLCIPSDMPYPDDASFHSAVARALVGLVLATGGRALVLFTSYAMMSSVHERIVKELTSGGLEVLKQGEAPRSLLVERLRDSANMVLLATDSFWEGVDVPGDALSCVVMARLPFRVPTDPIQEARYEAIERRGQNPFLWYSLPQAVIKFKQGFGRLIRTRSDKGAVVVYDRRLIGKPYGRVFLDSLPECRTLHAPVEKVNAAVGAWLSPRA